MATLKQPMSELKRDQEQILGRELLGRRVESSQGCKGKNLNAKQFSEGGPRKKKKKEPFHRKGIYYLGEGLGTVGGTGIKVLRENGWSHIKRVA